jgi:3-dehydroquinate synthase
MINDRAAVGEVTRIAVGRVQPYEVLVGHDLLGRLPALVPDAQRVAVIHPGALGTTAERVRAQLRDAGHEVLLVAVPDGEAAKAADVMTRCWTALGQAGFTRSDAVIGVGGGASTDVAGFVAATWLRGVRLVNVPTTLLGMVDAAVGGKTGINTAEGKNLVGAFHPPAAVVCDLDTLESLPPKDFAAGLAEVVKVGFTTDPVILDLVESDPAGAIRADGQHVRELVERAIRVKADVVSADPRESRPGGLGREVLNYGHTFAHAVEKVEHFSWRHGDAVSVGLVYVAELARLAGRLAERDAARHGAILGSLGLPTAYRGDRWAELLATMKVDKKSRGAMLRFVVLVGVGEPELLEDPDPELLRAAYQKVSA